jgi:hypothetical protein
MKKFNCLPFYMFIFGFLGLTGCSYSPHTNTYEKDIQEHVLRVNRHGYLIQNDIALASSHKKTTAKPLLNDHATNMIDTMFIEALVLSCSKQNNKNIEEGSCRKAIKQHYKKETHNLSSLPSNYLSLDTPIKLLIYFHGGLNTMDATDKRMEDTLDKIEKEKADWHYPIYVSWPSNAPGTYSEHLFNIREGRNTNFAVGLFSTPFILFEDLVTSVGKLPSTMYYQATNEKDRVASGIASSHLSSIWVDAFEQYKTHTGVETLQPGEEHISFTANSNNILVNRSQYSRGKWDQLSTGIGHTVVLPIRYVIGSVWNGVIASQSWDVMKRRARNMFYPSGLYDRRFQSVEPNTKQLDNKIGNSGQHAGLFFEKLFIFANKNPGLNIELTLVGHSMGTIAINNLLNKYQEDWISSNILSTIVYMAAAANIEETLSALKPVLKNKKSNIPFYNLTLNRVAEIAESYAYGLAPSGSLLVSIDKYHDMPEHHLKRTFGSENNIQSSLSTILDEFREIDSCITFKSFNSVKPDQDKILMTEPEKHGDFGLLPFWRKKIWSMKGFNACTSIR